MIRSCDNCGNCLGDVRGSTKYCPKCAKKKRNEYARNYYGRKKARILPRSHKGPKISFSNDPQMFGAIYMG